MDPTFVYEVRFIGPDESTVYSRLFYQVQVARDYIHKLAVFNTKRFQIPIVRLQRMEYSFNSEVRLYRVLVSDSINGHPEPTRLLIYETSPNDQYLFEYLQTKYEGRYVVDYEIKNDIKVEIELLERIKPLVIELFGTDLAAIIIEYIRNPINLKTLARQLKRLSNSRALQCGIHSSGHISYSALM